MVSHRIERVNSLLREVLSDVIRGDVKQPNVHKLATVTKVDITKDLSHAKVYISVLGTDKEREETITALQKAAGFISYTASKQVRLRHFPDLLFKLDDTADKHHQINTLIEQVQQERDERQV